MPESASSRTTSKLIADLWQRNQPLILERLAQLDAATQAASARTLTLGQREEAASTAHKLAGSVGMFGFPGGTSFAQQLEVELRTDAPSSTRLAELCAGLRAALFPTAGQRA
jgi:HPt (histidine-containing phosphotransfer) domain-containing protein